MDTEIQFTFRSKAYRCTFFIDCTDYPCYIFTFLTDKELIKQFGDEITLKTDGQILLPKKDDFGELRTLRETMFTAVKEIPEFIALKEKITDLGIQHLADYGQLRKLLVPLRTDKLIIGINTWSKPCEFYN
ncbi:MAG: hypothetical protein WCF67_25110 [Chitinophagaceae bacterium]